MPKKFQGENSKASIARARKAEAAAQEKLKKDQALEDAYWQDDNKQVNKKMARKEDREKKHQANLEKKAELRALAEQESVEVAQSVTLKPVPQKITQYQLEKNKEMRAEKEKTKEEVQTHLDVPLVENLNRSADEVISASGVDAALSALIVEDSSGDRHPEKRMAAAFKAFENKRMPQIKKENPSLRLSQLKQLLLFWCLLPIRPTQATNGDKMVRYSRHPENPTKSCKAKGSNLRCSFKNTCETANAINKMTLARAVRYLKNVIAKKECVPFRVYNGGIGRCAQAKAWGCTQGRWPRKSAEFLLDLLKNAESNAQYKGLEVDHLVIEHIMVQRARQMRRRTYRAHGRINPFMSSPCHIEVILAEKEQVLVAKSAEEPSKKKVSKKKLARQKLMAARE
ncbi:hypothetical protein Pmani_021237 [Petrolisthes manimaculis]|uniref:Large ribosomal subunit protein uL22 n=1 Tax=Petrolisthes manimaculis TaxID=1843537 RepID=A0AAE1PEK8_9EUCA|nr:hypothetical protein Pmani_021237 [Petrolisthes manimaculis]